MTGVKLKVLESGTICVTLAKQAQIFVKRSDPSYGQVAALARAQQRIEARRAASFR